MNGNQTTSNQPDFVSFLKQKFNTEFEQFKEQFNQQNVPFDLEVACAKALKNINDTVERSYEKYKLTKIYLADAPHELQTVEFHHSWNKIITHQWKLIGLNDSNNSLVYTDGSNKSLMYTDGSNNLVFTSEVRPNFTLFGIKFVAKLPDTYPTFIKKLLKYTVR